MHLDIFQDRSRLQIQMVPKKIGMRETQMDRTKGAQMAPKNAGARGTQMVGMTGAQIQEKILQMEPWLGFESPML